MGRFRTPTSCHYEYLCKQPAYLSAIAPESFKNDGSPGELLLKAIRRTMAAEYSRDCRRRYSWDRTPGRSWIPDGLATGIWAPADAGHLSDGRCKAVFEERDHKSLVTDRVILVPGPAREVRCVRTHLPRSLQRSVGSTQIAREFNQRRIAYRNGIAVAGWHVNGYYQPKYSGCLVWNGPLGGYTALYGPRRARYGLPKKSIRTHN